MIARQNSAMSVAALSTSTSDTISFGERIYGFGIDTSPVSTPSRAM